MSHGYPNQGPPPTYDATRHDDEPLFSSPPEERTENYASYPSMSRPPQQQHTSTFGAPPMGEPSEPGAHPDNKTAATQTAGASSGIGVPGHFSTPPTDGLGRQPSGSFDKATLGGGGGGGGLRRQSSGAYDATSATKTDTGVSSGPAPNATAPGANHFKQTPSQPGVPGSTPVGVQPGSPYVQTQEVPATGKSPMNSIVENFNKYMAKAEGLAGNVWGHLKTGPSVTDTAWGRMSQGAKLLTEGGFEGVYKATFGMADGEQLRKTYACYLSTSTGPVSGTLYISNLKFSFCSDRPLSYAPTPGQQAWSYYKVVVPLDKVKEVVPSFNENKPLEKYIQVVAQDGHDFWFMGFINYDKGVKNMQLALKHIGEIDPNGGLKSPFAGLRSSSQQPSVPGHNPTSGGPPPNYPPTQPTGTANPYTVK